MATYHIKVTTNLPGAETMYWQEEHQNWTIDSSNCTIYTSKAKVDTGISLLPEEGFAASGITTAVKLS